MTPCIHTPARCNGGGYDGCACGPFRPAEGTAQDLALLRSAFVSEDFDEALARVAARLDTLERAFNTEVRVCQARTRELERLRDGLRHIAETSGLTLNETRSFALSLLASSSPQPGEGTAA